MSSMQCFLVVFCHHAAKYRSNYHEKYNKKKLVFTKYTEVGVHQFDIIQMPFEIAKAVKS